MTYLDVGIYKAEKKFFITFDRRKIESFDT